MTSRFVGVLAFALSVAAGPAFAQEDDLLAPLTPATKEKPKRTKKPPKEKKPAPKPDDELLAPLTPSGKTELIVKLAVPVKGAKLFVDDNEVGAFPVQPLTVSPGEHTIAVKRAGYGDFVKKVTVAAGKSTEVVAALEAVAGFLSVTADVPDAQVFLDGSPLGTAPLTEVLLPPGNHEVAVRKEGHRPDVQRLAVRAGKEYQINARLEPEVAVAAVTTDRPERTELLPPVTAGPELPIETVTQVDEEPLYKKWYVWAGVGAVVVAASTTAIVVNNQNVRARQNQAMICDVDKIMNPEELPAGYCGN